jgi:hypothetical protein
MRQRWEYIMNPDEAREDGLETVDHDQARRLTDYSKIESIDGAAFLCRRYGI